MSTHPGLRQEASGRCSPAVHIVLAVLVACTPRAAEPLADEYLGFPEYVDPPTARDTLAPVRDLIPWDTVPPRIAPEEAHVTAGVEILPHGPPVLHAGASVRDAQGRLASAGTLCLLGLRMHRPKDSRPVWTSVDRGETCAPARHPGAVTSVGFPPDPRNPQRFRVADILGDSLPIGKYRFTALVRLESDTLELDAGQAYLSRDTLPPVTGPEALAQLRYRAETGVERGSLPQLRTRVTVTNAGPRRVEISPSGCVGTRLRAYRIPERAGHPVWDSSRKGGPCLLMLEKRLLEPGETFDRVGSTLPLHEFLGDSLPEGRYHFTMSLIWLHPPSAGERLREDTVHLPAGDAELVQPRGPFPAHQTANHWRMSADTRLTSQRPDMLLFTLTVTNTAPGPRVFLGTTPSPCAHFEVQRTRIKQEELYGDRRKLEAARAWSPRGCVLRLEPVRLHPGESHTYGARIAARTILGDSLPPGRYHFLTSLSVQGSDRQSEDVVVSAGDARLRR